MQDDKADDASTTSQSAQIQIVLSSWETWRGSFGDFCDHVRDQQRISFGPSLISQILFVHGKRRPQRRAGRSPDERALRGAFETFFGGAQWVGDGSPIPVTINGQRFVFNLELDGRRLQRRLRRHVGPRRRRQRRGDRGARRRRRDDARGTPRAAPRQPTLQPHPTGRRGPRRRHAQDPRHDLSTAKQGSCGGRLRPLSTVDPRARPPLGKSHASWPGQVLVLVAQTWARTLNHRPRDDRGGRSRVELYNEPITAEQVDAARAALEERCKKQKRARLTAMARQDPIVRALLDDAFRRLALLDPERHLRVAIARYPIDIVVEGIAIFEAKRRVGTLPPGVDARYLLGIVQNLGNEREGIAIAQELLRARLDARDRMLAPLVEAREDARRHTPDLRDRVLRFADLALATDRLVDRLFWLLAAADDITTHVGDDPAPLLDASARRIHATHRVPYRERLEAVRVIVESVVPLA